MNSQDSPLPVPSDDASELLIISSLESPSRQEDETMESEDFEVESESGLYNTAGNRDKDYDRESDSESAVDQANAEQAGNSKKRGTEEQFGFQTFAKSSRAIGDKFYTRKTISDDQSAGSKIEERNLLVLRDRADKGSGSLPTRSFNFSGSPAGTNHQLQQQHLMQSVQMQQHLQMHQMQQRQHLQMQQQHQMQHHQQTIQRQIMAQRALNNGASRESEVVNDPADEQGLRNVLDGEDASRLDLQKLQEYIERLQAKAQEFGAIQKEQVPFRYQILYRIWQKESAQDKKAWATPEGQYSLPFFDHPEWVRGQGKASRIQSNLPLDNFELYREKNKDIAFIVYRNFDTDLPSIEVKRGSDDARTSHLPQHTSETVRPINRDLLEAVKSLLGSRQEYAELLREYSTSYELPAPYLFIYHNRNSLEQLQPSLSVPAKSQLSLLWKYVTEQYADEYAAADSLLSQDKISQQHIPYLFKPGDLLVSRADDQYTGYVANSWPKISGKKKVSRMGAAPSRSGTTLPFYGSQDAASSMATDKITVYDCQISVWHWDFDGHFQRKHETLCLEIPAIEDEGEDATETKGNNRVQAEGRAHKGDLKGKTISELNVFPIRYASADITDNVRRRGKTFWKCRNRSYVSYQDSEMENIQNQVDERYMVDYKTYRSLHPDNSFSRHQLVDELGPEAMARDEPPDEQFELLLPLKIKGYNLRRKKWFDLFADRISDVKWNKEAFQNLVIDFKARDLIQALVSNQLAAEKGTDLIMGKGNGLILLLHGGPGTGKTLTAESVAEIAEKPLYRVTCGDVGTKAEEVERYLESVLHLGKIWGCVVLLDEADVFLEQRSLEDMERNALVSVFLRVLEYYEGILVLTSNRVGTFDEAFKSRIQLALHYPVLGPYQRLRIWENFIRRLETFGGETKVDVADLRDHLEDLKEEKMNGRQIRNAITTARQYAEWKGTTLTYEHLREVIEVSGRFDKYLDRLKGGEVTEDEG